MCDSVSLAVVTVAIMDYYHPIPMSSFVKNMLTHCKAYSNNEML
jgi:hypothetical protein